MRVPDAGTAVWITPACRAQRGANKKRAARSLVRLVLFAVEAGLFDLVELHDFERIQRYAAVD